MERPPHILFISAFETTFIRADLDFFRSRYPVTSGIGKGLMHLLGVLIDAGRCDVVYSWFASVYGASAVLWGKLLGKKAILQLGGVDVAKDEVSGYGTWNSWWRSLIVGQAIRRADRVLVVDASLGEEAKQRARYDGANIEVLETRFPAHDWFPSGERGSHVLTVAAVPDQARVRIKGIDVLLRAAERSPDIPFVILGVHERIARRLSVPPNVTIEGERPAEVVLARMQAAKVYCQSSRREGLSNALCEAMLCGCIPVATETGGSRRAVGDTGFLVEPGDDEALADAIVRAMSADASAGLDARERIKTEFPEDRRWKRLVEIVEDGGGATS